MRIIHVVPYYAPAWSYGGTPRAVYELVMAQKKLGHQITVITTTAFQKNEEFKKGRKIEQGVEVIRVTNLIPFFSWKFHFVTPLVDDRTYKTLKAADVIHIHETRTLLNILILLKLKNKKIFFSPWGTLPFNDRLVIFKTIVDFLLIPLFKENRIIAFAQTKHELDLLKKKLWVDMAYLIPLGINFKHIKNEISKKIAREKLNLPLNKKIFCFLGRFSRAKGINLLAKSFLSQKINGAILVYIGRNDGGLTELKKIIDAKKANKKIKILEPLFGNERFLAYLAADYFISTPIVYEETSTTCLEALACSCPVITTWQAEIPEMRIDQGVLHLPAKTSAIRKAINICNYYSLKVDKKKLEQYFSWNKIAIQINEIYENK